MITAVEFQLFGGSAFTLVGVLSTFVGVVFRFARLTLAGDLLIGIIGLARVLVVVVLESLLGFCALGKFHELL